VLYRLVQQHLATWLAERREADPDGVPIASWIERELRAYLTCGILAHGFARARCPGCGHDFLIAFSCKGRGVCPSCTTRRMAALAAQLVEHVFPRVPVRQWVVTYPKRLRYFLHRDPALWATVRRVTLRVIERHVRRACENAPRTARCGAVSFPQRFGSALNAHTHLHICMSDGLFSAEGGALRFHPAQLTESDFLTVAENDSSAGVAGGRASWLPERRDCRGSEELGSRRRVLGARGGTDRGRGPRGTGAVAALLRPTRVRQ